MWWNWSDKEKKISSMHSAHGCTWGRRWTWWCTQSESRNVHIYLFALLLISLSGFNQLHCHPVLSVGLQVRGVLNLWDAWISPMLCYTSGELFFDWWSWVVCFVSMLYMWRFNSLGVLLWGCTFLHLELHFFNIKECGSWVVSQTWFSGFFLGSEFDCSCWIEYIAQ